MKHSAKHILSLLFTLLSLSTFSQPDPTPQAYWAFKSADHYFSSHTTKDHFVAAVQGSSILSGEFVFWITDASGMTLFKETYPVAVLLGMSDPKNDKETEEIIRNRIDAFFDETHFSDPAIKPADEYFPEQSDKEIWDEIKEDSTAIGFFFLIDKANGRSIAWSKKQKKVVVYSSCC